METYKSYQLHEVWKYRDANNDKYVSSDWEVYKGDNEKGMLFHRKTVAEVKASIDEILEEQNA